MTTSIQRARSRPYDKGVLRSDVGISVAFLRALLTRVPPTGHTLLSCDERMRKPRSALILFVLLVLSLYLAVPLEDVLETIYDESETQPYEDVPLFALLLSPAAGCNRTALSSIRLHSGVPSRLAAAYITDTDSHRSAEASVALALLCTLLC